jgi:integrase
VAADEIGEALELLWGTAAVNTWNSRRAAVLSWLGWCRDRGSEGPAVPVWAKRLAVPDSETPAHSKMAIDRLVARREVHLRKKTLWRMLYETAGRAEEILGVNIEDLDFASRRCLVKAKGARTKNRRRGQVRRDYVEHTALRGPGTGWDLHEYRHSALTHLGQQGASLLMLMAKSRHKKLENVRRYFKQSPEAIAELTSLLAPGGSNR